MLANWIVPNVMMFGHFFLIVAQAVIKKAVLPDDPELPGCVALPASQKIRHHCPSGEAQNDMKVVRHQQE